MQRVLVVPWSMAAEYLAITTPYLFRSPRVLGGGQDQMRRCRSRILVSGTPLTEIARPALVSDKRDRGFHPVMSGGGRPFKCFAEARTVTHGLQQSGIGRLQRIDHRLVLQ